jgi:hypothetical protein
MCIPGLWAHGRRRLSLVGALGMPIVSALYLALEARRPAPRSREDPAAAGSRDNRDHDGRPHHWRRADRSAMPALTRIERRTRLGGLTRQEGHTRNLLDGRPLRLGTDHKRVPAGCIELGLLVVTAPNVRRSVGQGIDHQRQSCHDFVDAERPVPHVIQARAPVAPAGDQAGGDGRRFPPPNRPAYTSS